MNKVPRTRLDQRVLELGLAETRSRARALIMAGRITVDGEIRDKPGETVKSSQTVALIEKAKYVSRGGEKLAGPLADLGVGPEGRVCLDVGSSTGGFTDCLLQRGAARVYCVDVGKGVLDWRLRQDERVVVKEETNARYLSAADFPELCDLAVVDVSFISLEHILPALAPLLKQGATALCLVKPQFEAGREKVGKGGVVRDESVINECVDKVSDCGHSLGFEEKGRAPSPLRGPKGNREIFIRLDKE